MNTGNTYTDKTLIVEPGRCLEKPGLMLKIRRDFKKNRELYFLLLPVLLFYLVFQYGPMFGLVVAFKDYSPGRGFFDSDWVGFKHFIAFFQDFYFLRVLKNTIVISVSTLLFSFPMPIILALLINELKGPLYSRTVQSITYMPHFISTVVICGMIIQLTNRDGAITQLLAVFGVPNVTLLGRPELFVPIYIISDIWQTMGWNSIIYLSALIAIDPQLYEAAKIDGAGKFRQFVNVTVPSISGTIIIMLILRIGKMFKIGYEKIMLLYNPITYETADVISTYVYRKGLLEFDFSYSAAVGLFNSIVSFTLVYMTNRIARRTSGTSLW